MNEQCNTTHDSGVQYNSIQYSLIQNNAMPLDKYQSGSWRRRNKKALSPFQNAFPACTVYRMNEAISREINERGGYEPFRRNKGYALTSALISLARMIQQGHNKTSYRSTIICLHV